MDYILRDSKETGVSFGNFDINDLITSMQITFFENDYYVCIPEKNISYVEGYLYARYQMYRNVYMGTYKIFTEELLKRIIQRAKELYNEGNISGSPSMKCIFNKNGITVQEFLKLDDQVIMASISDWVFCEDKILSALCNSFLNRNGFRRLTLFHNKKEDIELFKEKFMQICRKYIKIENKPSNSKYIPKKTMIFSRHFIFGLRI